MHDIAASGPLLGLGPRTGIPDAIRRAIAEIRGAQRIMNKMQSHVKTRLATLRDGRTRMMTMLDGAETMLRQRVAYCQQLVTTAETRLQGLEDIGISSRI